MNKPIEYTSTRRAYWIKFDPAKDHGLVGLRRWASEGRWGHLGFRWSEGDMLRVEGSPHDIDDWYVVEPATPEQWADQQWSTEDRDDG